MSLSNVTCKLEGVARFPGMCNASKRRRCSDKWDFRFDSESAHHRKDSNNLKRRRVICRSWTGFETLVLVKKKEISVLYCSAVWHSVVFLPHFEFCLNPATSSHQIHNGDDGVAFCCFTGVTTTILEKRSDARGVALLLDGRAQIFVHLEPPAAKPPSLRKRHGPTVVHVGYPWDKFGCMACQNRWFNQVMLCVPWNSKVLNLVS